MATKSKKASMGRKQTRAGTLRRIPTKEDLLVAGFEEAFTDSLQSTLFDEKPGREPLDAVRHCLVALASRFDTKRVAEIDRLLNSPASLLARRHASFVRMEENLFKALCKIWPEPDRSLAHRMLAMTSIGALRIAIDESRADVGAVPIAGHLIRAFSILIPEERSDDANAREAVRDQLTQLNLIEERFPGFLWKALPDGSITLTNKYTEEYLGMTSGELPPGTGWIDLIHPDDREVVTRRWEILVNGGQWPEHVHRLKGKDGQYRWFQSRITTIKDDSGAVVALHGLMVDAHTIVSAEKSVRQEEEQLRRLVDAMPAMIWRADSNGRIDRWNRTMIEAIGKPWETTETFDLMSRINPAEVTGVMDRWVRSVGLGIPYEDIYRILGNDGNYHSHLVRAIPIRNVDGQIVSWYGIHTDISALKEAENALQMREDELLGIIDTVPSMLWSTMPSGEPTHINRRLQEYCGMSFEEFCDFGWKSIVHPDDVEGVAQKFSKALQAGISFEDVHRLRRQDGEYRWHHARGEPLRDTEGRIIQWYGLLVDINDRKSAEDHLRETRQKLNKASRIAMVAELSASIAHELNQPLTSVLANAQASQRWLYAEPPNLVEATSCIERIVRDAKAAGETIHRIKGLFGRESLKRREASLSELVGEAIRLIREDQSKPRIPIECIFEDDLPHISVDPIQIHEVLLNLISNAIEAMGGESREPRILIRAFAVEANEVAVQIVDNGPGVTDLEKIFDAFVTTKEKGMGIGLAVSLSIVEAHDGKLWAENNPDHGATLTMRIPGIDRSPT